MEVKKALSGTRLLEPLHLSLSSSDWQVRVFRSIVSIDSLLMVNIDLQCLQCSAVGTKLVSNDSLWPNLLFLKKFTEQSQSGSSVASGLN